MNLTEEQITEAKKELERRAKERDERYQREYLEQQRAAQVRFDDKMDMRYPDVDRETRYSIYIDYCEFYG